MIRIAVVGLGRWGPNYMRIVNSLEGGHVAAGVDADQTRLAGLRDVYPTVDFVSGIDEVLGRDDVDAIVVATPTGTHHDLVCRTLEAGKHVLCEKPLAGPEESQANHGGG